MNEAELQDAVIECARLLGWRVAHFRPALTAAGWRTPVSGDGAGFPDLCLVRDRIVFAELKSTTGAASVNQADWAAAITASGTEMYLWRPANWVAGRIETVLRSRKEPA